jgi:hypothetical protein
MYYIFYDKNTIHFFIDYINSFINNKFILTKLNDKINKTLKILNDDKNKFFFINKFPKKINKNIIKNCYLINTEQITRSDIIKLFKKYPKELQYIDYSYTNIKISPVKMLYLPYQVNNNEIFNHKKIYDVVIIGTMSEKRKYIYDNLSTKIKIDWLNGWANERDDKLFRYKILVNIHYDSNYNIFEELRCNRCIYNKIIVISETSNYNKKFNLSNHMIECEYNDICNYVIDVLNKYDYYYNKLFCNFDLDAIDKLNLKYYKKIFDS